MDDHEVPCATSRDDGHQARSHADVQAEIMVDLRPEIRITDRRARSIATGEAAILYARIEGAEHVLLSDEFHTRGLNSTKPRPSDAYVVDDFLDTGRVLHANLVSHSDRQQMVDLAVGSGVVSLRVEIGEAEETHPMSKYCYESLPHVVLTERAALLSGMCTICRNEFGAGDVVIKLLCAHTFCEGCLHKWSLEHSSCPVCRFTLPMESVYHEMMRIKKYTVQQRTSPYSVAFDWAYLQMQSVKTLRTIMRTLCIPKGHCIEKRDLIATIEGSCGVKVLAPQIGTSGTDTDADQGRPQPAVFTPFPIAGVGVYLTATYHSACGAIGRSPQTTLEWFISSPPEFFDRLAE